MRTMVFATILAAVLVVGANADQFKLKDTKTGEVFGPFENLAGTQIAVKGNTYVLVKEQNEAQKAFEEKLRSIVIPTIGASARPIQEVMYYITDAKAPGHVFFKYILALPEKMPMVTLDARNISVWDILTYLSEAMDLSLTITSDGSAVILKPASEQDK